MSPKTKSPKVRTFTYNVTSREFGNHTNYGLVIIGWDCYHSIEKIDDVSKYIVEDYFERTQSKPNNLVPSRIRVKSEPDNKKLENRIEIEKGNIKLKQNIYDSYSKELRQHEIDKISADVVKALRGKQ